MALIPVHGAMDGSHRRECGACEMARCRRGRQTIRRQKYSPHRVFTGGTVEKGIPMPKAKAKPTVWFEKTIQAVDIATFCRDTLDYELGIPMDTVREVAE